MASYLQNLCTEQTTAVGSIRPVGPLRFVILELFMK